MLEAETRYQLELRLTRQKENLEEKKNTPTHTTQLSRRFILERNLTHLKLKGRTF